MSEMVERAVRALEHLGYSATDEEKVHAVISAMREPTEAMCAAAAPLGFCRPEDAEEIYRAMIDAALAP